jgi:hypothetical protein
MAAALSSSVVRGLLLALLLTVTTTVVQADGSGSADPAAAAPRPKKPAEEPPVDPTGLIIAGAALAAFAVLLLVGRRKKRDPQAHSGDLAEVRLVIETDERATVWTSSSPSLKLATDRLGEVVFHLPIGHHDVHVQVSGETFMRPIQVTAIKRMRLPINLTKERIARASSGEMPAIAPPGSANRSGGVRQVPGFESSQPAQKSMTSAARAYPDSAVQSQLGAQLAGLIDVELDAKPDDKLPLPLDTGLDPGAGAIDFSPQRAGPTTPPQFSLDVATPSFGGPATPAPGPLELDDPDLDIPVAAAVLPPPPARPSPLRDARPTGAPVVRSSALRDAGPSRGRPPTSPLEGIRSPTAEPARRSPLAPAATSSRPNLDISLDEISPVEPPARTSRSTAAPAFGADRLLPPEPLVRKPKPDPKAAGAFAEFALDELAPSAPASIEMPTAGVFDLAPPERGARTPAPPKQGLPDVSDFALDHLSAAPRPAAPVDELPKVSAASVMDLTLDEDDLPVHRMPAAQKFAAKPTPDINEFVIEDTPPPQPPRAAADDRPSRPLATTPAPALPAMPPISAPRASAPALPSRVPAVPAIPARPPAPGVIGGRYRKGTGVGAGPIGALYRGRDESASRDVMIEEVPSGLVFEVPAPQLAKLEHANVVRFIDHVVDANKGYVITELLEGKSLELVLAERGGSLAALEAIGIIDQVCSGLAYAHERGVFHHNVRPACILISGRTAKLTGFGMSLGKATPYTAPEVVAGNEADARSDLYSVGITLVQLLAGAVPVPGKLELPADVPRSLASLIRKLVSREPMIRPGNVKSVRDAFSAVF